MPEDVLVFSCSHKQGVNFKPGVWHHPLLVLAEHQDFLVIDRAGEGVISWNRIWLLRSWLIWMKKIIKVGWNRVLDNKVQTILPGSILLPKIWHIF